VIINASNPAEQTQIGINVGPHDNPFHYLQWTKDNQLIFEGHGGVYIFNLHTGNTSLLFASSSEPYVFSSQ